MNTPTNKTLPPDMRNGAYERELREMGVQIMREAAQAPGLIVPMSRDVAEALGLEDELTMSVAECANAGIDFFSEDEVEDA